jgi:hypothetical protein
VAARLLGQELVDEVLSDMESSRLDAAHKELFRYIGRLVENPAQIASGDISKLKQLGWSEEAIYDALTVASLFKFYNTWNNGSGVQQMSLADYASSGNRLLKMGYCMDFGIRSVMKVICLGRKEITLSDLGALMRAVVDKLFRSFRAVLGKGRRAGSFPKVEAVQTNQVPTPPVNMRSPAPF